MQPLKLNLNQNDKLVGLAKQVKNQYSYLKFIVFHCRQDGLVNCQGTHNPKHNQECKLTEYLLSDKKLYWPCGCSREFI